jgi:tetratricopeptide (TPR) repeat protein
LKVPGYYLDAMKRVSGLFVVLALTAVGGALAYQAAAREQQYRVLLDRGEQALAEGQTFGAIEAFSGAIALRSESMLAHLRRGETYRQRGDLDAAARDFRRAAILDPSATRPLDALGEVLYQRQRFKSAAEVYENRLQLDDRSEQVAYRLALARYRDGNTEGALSAVTQALRLSDGLADAYYLMGLCLRERNRLPEAIDAFEKAIARTPNMISAREELADAYGAAGRHGEELEQLQYIALLDREHVERQVAVGLAHARGGRGELAVLTLGNALERTPDQTLVYGALGKVWLDMASTRSDALSKALEALERVAATAGATSEIMTLYGRALLRADQPEAAERALQQATERYPVEPEAFLAYADLAERHDHFAAARTALIDYGALEGTDEGSVSRTVRIAALSLRMNEPAAAADWFLRASEAAPADVGLLVSLADAQLRAGDREAARATVVRGTEKNPQNTQFMALARKLGIKN